MTVLRVKMGENVKVVVRCRPMNQKEIDSKCESIVEIGGYAVSVLNPLARNAPKKVFTFDSVYDMISSTETVYNDMCYSLVESTLEGYNGTIFAYGQTGCGKTHTMQGELGNSNDGIIPKCFDHIFESIAMASSVRYLALVSYLEIYNENIRDLLSADDAASMASHPLKEVPGLGVTVPTLTTQAVVNAKQCYNWLSVGNRNRATAATLMNEKSSRSHTIFTISLEQFQGPFTSSAPIPREGIMGGIRRGKLNLVDLAGSERQRKTGAFGDRLKEAAKINLSLSALGNVISSLVDGKTKHVPYRDSKLTRLLQDSLGGNTKTIMISCISPADSNYDETLSTLRYASRAKNISNKPHINEDPKDAQLRQYQCEIMKLKRMLEDTQQLTEVSRNSEGDSADRQNPEEAEAEQSGGEELQLQARTRIDLIKQALIGGERAHDVQLRERHRVRKMEAQRHLSALAHALSRVESEDRDLLQGHYASISQEISTKNEHIKMCRQKIKMLEREVSDLNSEFQLDREDYLEEIRHLGRNIKFYQQLLARVQPILRKNGKNWNPDIILQSSTWNDDLKTWRIPDSDSFKLPPANLSSAFSTTSGREGKEDTLGRKRWETAESDEGQQGSDTEVQAETYKVDILQNYFRRNRQKNKDYTQRTQRTRSSQVFKDFMPRNTGSINEMRITLPEKDLAADYKLSRLNNPLGMAWSSVVMEKMLKKNSYVRGLDEEQHSVNDQL